jgi:hypothetical protein
MKLNWGRSLIIFFVLFFSWVLFFLLFAMNQDIDLVSEDYYQKGAKYDEQILIDQRSVTYQDSIQVDTTADHVKFTFCNSLSGSGDSLEIYFFRSSDMGKDLRLNLKQTGSPLMIEKSLLSRGRYQIFINWRQRGEKYMVKKILDVD